MTRRATDPIRATDPDPIRPDTEKSLMSDPTALPCPDDAALTVPLHWLDGPPRGDVATQWGAPWPRGTVTELPAMAVLDPASPGSAAPVDSWVTARWPDGWRRHSVCEHGRSL